MRINQASSAWRLCRRVRRTRLPRARLGTGASGKAAELAEEGLVIGKLGGESEGMGGLEDALSLLMDDVVNEDDEDDLEALDL